jgi:hypothetical protein
MANAPLSEQDGLRYRLIWDFGKAEYFFKRGWTGQLQNSLTGKSTGPRGLGSLSKKHALNCTASGQN